jgi:hypothetical protein
VARHYAERYRFLVGPEGAASAVVEAELSEGNTDGIGAEPVESGQQVVVDS